MQTAQGAGVELAYTERGDGPALLFIHGIAADAAAFDPQLEALAPHARAIAYDRRGYGSSGTPEPYEGTTVDEQAQDAIALLHALAVDQALVCGDGFGALIALELLKRHPSAVSGAVLADPPVFAFVPAANELLAQQADALRRAVATGGPEAAVDSWLAGRLEGRALDRARAAHRAFFADYAGLSTLELTRAQLRAIAVPVIVLTGPMTPRAIAAAADSLAELIPGARRAADGDVTEAALDLLGVRGP